MLLIPGLPEALGLQGVGLLHSEERAGWSNVSDTWLSFFLKVGVSNAGSRPDVQNEVVQCCWLYALFRSYF